MRKQHRHKQDEKTFIGLVAIIAAIVFVVPIMGNVSTLLDFNASPDPQCCS